MRTNMKLSRKQRKIAAINAMWIRNRDGKQKICDFAEKIAPGRVTESLKSSISSIEVGRSFGFAGPLIARLAGVTVEEFVNKPLAPEYFIPPGKKHFKKPSAKAQLKTPRLRMNSRPAIPPEAALPEPPLAFKSWRDRGVSEVQFQGSDGYSATINGVDVVISGARGKRVKVVVE